MTVMDIVERNWIPDVLIRAGIRQQVKRRLQQIEEAAGGDPEGFADTFAEELTRLPIAVHTREANEQHYELPSEFFEEVLGPNLKYSSAFFPPEVFDLATAEDSMLNLYADRAQIAASQKILDLGCGWGSLSLYLARRYPECRITALSNSRPQRRFIEARSRERGLTNLEVLTADIRTFETDEQFDRVVSIEMFEHMKNYRLLLRKIHGFLKPHGKLFVHVFAHRQFPYHFESDNDEEWMARHFFTGGLMPSVDLLNRFQDDLRLEARWRVLGTHYEKTANAWLENMDAARPRLFPVMKATYGRDAERWWRRWRIFFMACAELFGFNEGEEWQVAHYRFVKNRELSG